MTYQKMIACPKCGSAEFLGVCAYESGWRHVECDAPGCRYFGPGEGNKRDAIKAHNSVENGENQ